MKTELKRKLASFVVICLMLLIFTGSAIATDWPMFNRDLENTVFNKEVFKEGR